MKKAIGLILLLGIILISHTSLAGDLNEKFNAAIKAGNVGEVKTLID